MHVLVRRFQSLRRVARRRFRVSRMSRRGDQRQRAQCHRLVYIMKGNLVAARRQAEFERVNIHALPIRRADGLPEVAFILPRPHFIVDGVLAADFARPLHKAAV